MNPFWNKIVMTLVFMAALVSAKYAVAWVANHTWRADRYQAAMAERAKAPLAPKVNYSASLSSISNFRGYEVTERQVAEYARRKAAARQHPRH
jgi:hypothetical protein